MAHILGALLVIAVIAVGVATPFVILFGMFHQWYRDTYVHPKAPPYRSSATPERERGYVSAYRTGAYS